MGLTLADLLERHWPAYQRKHSKHLCRAHYRAVRSVLQCRTPALGGRLYRCADCKQPHFAYHSCNHRSCPQCGAASQQAWSAKQEARLLPVDYFMVTFTLPSELRSLCAKHPRVLYDLLLTQSAAALKDLVASKYQGAECGFISVLHTWGRQLQHHPHVHLIVPAALFKRNADELVQPSQTDGKSGFLVHFRPLAIHFRHLVGQALQQHPEIYGQLSPQQRQCLKPAKTWNVQLQQVGRGQSAIRYLARYVQKSGYTDKRLVGYTPDGKGVLLRWTCSNTGKPGVLRLSIEEFIRRWLIHTLPKGFARVRHYGYLSAAAKKTRLRIRLLLGASAEAPAIAEPQDHACPHCKTGKLQFLRELPRCRPLRGPPQTFTIS